MLSTATHVPTFQTNKNEIQNLIQFIYKYEQILKEFGALKIQLHDDCKLALKKRPKHLLISTINKQVSKENKDDLIYSVQQTDRSNESIKQRAVIKDETDFCSSEARDPCTPCRYGRDCRDRSNRQHCSKYSHSYDQGSKSSVNLNHERTPCRYGRDCRDKYDSGHCSKYLHPHNDGCNSSSISSHDQTPCRYGRDCRDKSNPQHCSKYSHPHNDGSNSSSISSHDQIPCRYGRDCRDKNDSGHCSKYSHDHGPRPSSILNHNQTPCRYGRDCRDKHDPRHCSKYSHANK
ncbi:unnamed protein product [Adineta steineri]|uniref:PBZ-type domain-containing protein n=1 Tax=Adineta steineri TaxID=433720 RepID=A0A815BXM1_9BILA|nr:unnamed protein product [Adineta steineri]